MHLLHFVGHLVGLQYLVHFGFLQALLQQFLRHLLLFRLLLHLIMHLLHFVGHLVGLQYLVHFGFLQALLQQFFRHLLLFRLLLHLIMHLLHFVGHLVGLILLVCNKTFDNSSFFFFYNYSSTIFLLCILCTSCKFGSNSYSSSFFYNYSGISDILIPYIFVLNKFCNSCISCSCSKSFGIPFSHYSFLCTYCILLDILLVCSILYILDSCKLSCNNSFGICFYFDSCCILLCTFCILLDILLVCPM